VRDHVIVGGRGNLGSRVVEELRKRRVPVVAVEKNRDAVGIQAARAAGAQVLLGDASRTETLQEADVKYCRSLVAIAKQDFARKSLALFPICPGRFQRQRNIRYYYEAVTVVTLQENKRRIP
jgi:nucleoside-diphosphate-sugar epimerase